MNHNNAVAVAEQANPASPPFDPNNDNHPGKPTILQKPIRPGSND
jgi:hypothetical protein